MALSTLLGAGAEPVAMGIVGTIPWQTDSQGRQYRRQLTAAERQTIRDRVQARLGRRLSGREAGELTRIVDAADNASRRAHQLNDSGRRLPRPSEIERLPGTGNAGGDTFTYTVAVEMVDRGTGQRRTFTLVIHDDRVMSGGEVVARAQEAIARNDITQRMGSGAPALRRAVIEGITVLSVYRGTPEL